LLRTNSTLLLYLIRTDLTVANIQSHHFFDLRSPAYGSSSPAELRRRATATSNLCLTLTFYEPSYFNTTGTKEEKAMEILIRSGAITEGRRLLGSQRGSTSSLLCNAITEVWRLLGSQRG
jgi:hypothetical protein